MMYEAVIGLEIHVQIDTRSKTFCRCSTTFGAPPNTHTCPVCLGLPGALPVLNAEVLRKAVTAGLALNCEISGRSILARKNYFYPDLPKAYQISQYELPLNRGGVVMIVDEAGREKRIGLTRAHIEEDAGKLVHDDDPKGPSYIDFNRCGVPLLEIVTEPDIRTPEEAERFLLAVKEIMQYTGVSACNMEKGELRVDVNISLRKGGDSFGVKQEIKNMNSFANVKRALEYEIKRQTRMLRSGESLVQETRLFDPQKSATVLMRTKEEAQDYRYFPDPDLVPIVFTDDYVREVGNSLAELPEERRRRFVEEYRLTEYDAINLCSSRMLADFFEDAVTGYREPKRIANWIMSEMMRHINEQRIGIDQYRVKPVQLRELFELMDRSLISGKIAKEVFEEMSRTGRSPSAIVEERGLTQMTDESEIASVIDEVIAENGSVVTDYRNGKDKALGYLIGQVMKKTRGKANPKLVNDLLKARMA